MTKTLLSRSDRRAELRRQLRDGDSTQLWTDDACNSALNEALTFVQFRYPTTKRTKIAATGARAYRLPADCAAVRRVEVQDGSTGSSARPPVEADNWEQVVGWDVDFVTALSNAWESTLVLDAPLAAPNLILVTYAPIPPTWGDAGSTATDATAIDLAPDEGDDRNAGLLLYAAARAACYRWAMAQLPSAGMEDYGREYAAALAERDKLAAMIPGPRPTLRISNGVFR